MVGVATYPGHSYIRDRFKEHLYQIVQKTKYPVKVFILWNGAGKPQKYFPKCTCKTMKFGAGTKGVEILRRKHNELRKQFLKSDCTHFFMLESDNLPPADILNRLVAHDVPVVQGVYFIRAEQKMKYHMPMNAQMLAKYGELAGKDIFIIKSQDSPAMWIQDGDNIRLGKIEDVVPQRGLIETYAGAMGNTLIKRELLEKIEFRIRDGEIQQFTDFLFWHDAQKLGYRTYTDTSIMTGHVHPYDEIGDQDKWFKPLTLEAV
jgi:hypothetical protein